MQKVVQRSLLNFLQTRLGLILLVCGALYCLNTAIGVLHLLITTSTSPLCPHCSQVDYADTLGTGADSRPTIVYPSGALDGTLTSYESTLCYEPIDIVYTWVNGSDPKLIADLAFWKQMEGEAEDEETPAAAHGTNGTTVNGTAAGTKTDSGDQVSNNRFRDNQELRYSLRSIWKFAPWVRHVFIVTNGHVPYWLNLNHPRVTLISHTDIFPNKSHLPTFSSPAIESHLHRIPGIASKFIYFNDDVMLGNRITPDDFVTHGGGQKIFLSWNVPNCAPGCPDTWLADKYCDSACNNPDCQFDMGDCVNSTRPIGGAPADSRYNSWESSRGGSGGSASNARYCSTGCPNNWVGDKVCDRACKNAECAFDGGDCGLELIKTHMAGLDLPNPAGDRIPVPEFHVPYGTASLYVNLSIAFPGATSIVEANHDNPAVVRSAIVTQNLKVLTLILFDELDVSEDGSHGDLAHLDDLTLNTTASMLAEAEAVLSPNRRVEIYIQGELNDVATNLTFNITRPRFPSAEQLAEAAASAAADAATNTEEEIKYVDPEAMFAAARAATAATDGAAAGLVPDDIVPAVVPGTATAAPIIREVEAGDEPLGTDSRPASGRRLLTVFDTLVDSLKAISRSPPTKVTAPAPKPAKRDLNVPYQPKAGYGHTRAYASAPASATRHSGVVASYRSPASVAARPDTVYDSWQDMPVFIDSVPISNDIAHSGVKLREGLDDTLSSQPGDNLWRSKEEHHVDHHASGKLPGNALHDATGRVIEAYGWTARDHELAAHIVQHKKKQLWLMEREVARQNFMDAWRQSQVEKRRLLEGRWEQVWADESSHEHDNDPTADRKRRPRFNRDPVWPWELRVAAPDLFEEWDWAAEAARFGKNNEAITRLAAHRPPGANKKHPFDGFEFEREDSSKGEHEVEVELSLFGLAADPVTALNNDLSSFGSRMPSSSGSAAGGVDPDDGHEHSKHADVSLPAGSGPRRTLLDLYGDSLRFVNTLYTSEFGKETRKAPAHMPHMIDVAIETELQTRWPRLFDDTSSHRFRHSHDMQYSFSYFYYLMNVPRSFSLAEVWQEQLDLNGDGVLDQIEIRYMTLWLSGKKILPRDLVKMHEKLLNTTKIVHGYAHEQFEPSDPPRIDIEVLSRSNDILDLIEDKWSSLRQYKFELVNLDQIEFYMVPDNTTKVQLRLDEIRSKMPKFVCLNDDMNKTADPPAATLQALKDFYISYFPNPSPFENPEDRPNQFMYIEDYRHHQRTFGWKERLGLWWTADAAAKSPNAQIFIFALSLAILAIALFVCGQLQVTQKCRRLLRLPKAHDRTA